MNVDYFLVCAVTFSPNFSGIDETSVIRNYHTFVVEYIYYRGTTFHLAKQRRYIFFRATSHANTHIAKRIYFLFIFV